MGVLHLFRLFVGKSALSGPLRITQFDAPSLELVPPTM